MIYAMSDIHGQYEQFRNLMEQIRFRKEDTLYILGDVVDRGPEPMKILKYMVTHSNIIPIIGNHEVMALPNLKLLIAEISQNFLGLNYFQSVFDTVPYVLAKKHFHLTSMP